MRRFLLQNSDLCCVQRLPASDVLETGRILGEERTLAHETGVFGQTMPLGKIGGLVKEVFTRDAGQGVRDSVTNKSICRAPNDKLDHGLGTQVIVDVNVCLCIMVTLFRRMIVAVG